MGGDSNDSALKNHWGDPNDRPHKVTGPCIQRTINALGVGLFVGTFFGSCQVAWYPDPIVSTVKRFGDTVHRHGGIDSSDLRAVLRAVSRPALLFSAVAGSFAAVECAAEAARAGKSDSWNAGLGGMVAGAVMASTTRRFDLMTAAAVGSGLLMLALDFTGPDTVWDKDALRFKMHGVLPERHVESERLAELKDKYPKFKDN